MTHEEKISYMRIATGIVGYGFDNKGLDMLVSLYELVIEKEGETHLKNVCQVEAFFSSIGADRYRVSFLPWIAEAEDGS